MGFRLNATRTRKRRKITVAETLEPRRVLDSTVVFNEISYHPLDGTAQTEWIEFHNQMAVDMDLSGWSLDGVDYQFPDNTRLEGGGYLVITGDPATFEQTTGASAFGTFEGRLSNAGESLRLINRSQREMDRVDYGDSFPWPAGADGTGVTLAKRSPQTGSEAAENWTHSEQIGGTPGQTNFPIFDDQPIVTHAIRAESAWRYHETGTDLGTDWRTSHFDDASWSVGNATLFAGEFQSINAPNNGNLPPSDAIAIRNPSFESNTNSGVGYGPIDNWTGGSGVNPTSTGTQPFADNGNLPDNRQIGFIQGPGAVEQTISGLEVGQEYLLEVYYNARNCCGASPAITVELDDTELFESTRVDPVGTGEDYYVADIPFTATSSSSLLRIRNTGGGGDHTLLLDGVSIIAWEANYLHVKNASFEASGSLPEPGYAQHQLAGWKFDGDGKLGIAQAGGQHLGETSIPSGQYAAFLEGVGSLHQTIDGLTPGGAYEIQVHVNATSGSVAQFNASLDGVAIIEDAVTASSEFTTQNVRFTATGTSIDLTLGQTDPSAVLLLDQVIVAQTDSPLVTEVSLGSPTYYFRHNFDFSGNPAETELALRYFFDDGAVIYLNGEELHRVGMPDGEINFGTFATMAVSDPTWSETVLLPGDALVSGNNVLAVEVHQYQANDNDMAMALDLVATQRPVNPMASITPLVINEVASHEASPFQLELYNHGEDTANLANVTLKIGDRSIELGTDSIQPGQVLGLTIDGLVSDNALVALFDSDGNRLLDALHVRDIAQARVSDGDDEWFHIETTTIGNANIVSRHDEIVINEIMYHQLPQFRHDGIPETFIRTPIVTLDHNWRYKQSEGGLPIGWQTERHEVGGDWAEGPGLFGFERGAVVSPGINTPFTKGEFTYYLETDFEITADDLATAERFQIRHAVDDGVVVYLNGEELFRFNMPEGVIQSQTRASRTVNNAIFSEALEVPHELLSVGQHRLSVEVHQRSINSSDLVFGLELSSARTGLPAEPAQDFVPNEEEWIELFNRTDQPVDVSDWALADAVEYTFPSGTIIPAGGYLVIARNAAALHEKYPEITILGNFSGSLNNEQDRIVLLDDFGNAADQVHYFEGGRWDARSDGGGASLELINANAENSIAESWSASHPPDIAWSDYEFRFRATTPSRLGTPSGFDEFIIGLLDAGEILLDDVQLIQDPDTTATNVLQNGNFEADELGTSPSAWRIIGNHSESHVVVDPHQPDNRALKLVATGATEHMHNHGETTLAENAEIQVGQEYLLKFRAKWLNGSPQLSTRLYFSNGASLTVIDTSTTSGTPGRQNSVWQNNTGPVFEGLRHEPIVPGPKDPVTIAVQARDPEGIVEASLYYSVDGGPFTRTEMALFDDSYSATIPPLPELAKVQFYVTATDNLGATNQFPADGPDSRALYAVREPLDVQRVHSFRILMTDEETTNLHVDSNVMSNQRRGATVIYNENEVFYDVGVRLRASGFGRRGALAGFNLRFDPQQLFRGVHRTIALDRGAVFSHGDGTGGVQGVPGASPHELVIYQIANRAGNIPAMYDDVMFVEAPRATNTGFGLLKMARYTNEFLDKQFENGGDGSLFKYELVYYARGTVDGNPESLKTGPNAVVGTDITNLGDNQEDYRHNFVLKNNRAKDDFSGIMQLGKALLQRDEALDIASQQHMDIDQWMRTFALESLVGSADTYNMGLAHNLELYVRPSDGKVLAFPWDVDHGFFYATESTVYGRGGSNLARVIRFPHNERLFLKHLLDIIETAYNAETVTPWAQHYTDITTLGDPQFFIDYVTARRAYVLDKIEQEVPRVDFQITTNDGADFTADTSVVTLQGVGWVDVDTIRAVGAEDELDVRWLDHQQWEIQLPLKMGNNEIALAAFNRRGETVGTDTINVTPTVADTAAKRLLRITELMYHPTDPTASEQAIDSTWTDNSFEYIELTNISTTETVPLAGVSLSDGPAEPFVFDNEATLGPGERIVLVANQVAFRARYGDVATIGGEYTGSFSNGGELIELTDTDGIAILSFTYSDVAPWPTDADGSGPSLDLIDPTSPVDSIDQAIAWEASAALGGTPGFASSSGDLNQDGQLTSADIDYFCKADDGRLLDFNGDRIVNEADLDFLVLNLMRTSFGDANFDGVFDSEDFVAVFVAGRYEDEIGGNATWATGDWNCDGDFDSEDIVKAFIGGSYSTAASTATAAAIAALDFEFDETENRRKRRSED